MSRCPKCGRSDDRETFDVKDRLIILSYSTPRTQGMVNSLLEQLAPVAIKLEEAGAVAVLLLPDDMSVTTMTDEQLAEIGLRKAPQITSRQ